MIKIETLKTPKTKDDTDIDDEDENLGLDEKHLNASLCTAQHFVVVCRACPDLSLAALQIPFTRLLHEKGLEKIINCRILIPFSTMAGQGSS